jgi:ABC-2 type transport system ATP-binding protein
MAEAAVAVRGLTKSFGRVTAVRGVSFIAPAGKITGFLGPNGSGKPVTGLWHASPLGRRR